MRSLPVLSSRGVLVLLLLLVVAAAIMLIDNNYKRVLQWLCPLHFAREISQAATAVGLDEFTLFAVVKVESYFDPRARSPKGALGLMQLMPTTADWVVEQLGRPQVSEEELLDPQLNLYIGAWYLAHLIDEFEGNLIVALAAYNGGRGNVKKWLDGEVWSGDTATVEDIPFPETRNFVKRVLATDKWYRFVYDNKWPAQYSEQTGEGEDVG